MTISIERSLRHMAWANHKVYVATETLPEVALESYLVKSEWTAREILKHICFSAGVYSFRLGVGPKGARLVEPQKISELRVAIATHDANLITASGLEDRELEWERDGRTHKNWSSTILSQAVHHATEHRAQLMDALEYRGYTPISLDDIDLWSFDQYERDKTT
jgi:uncharacterized damage-inducible protein DinB